MKLRQIILILGILFLGYIGYTLQPYTIPFEAVFPQEKEEHHVDHSVEISKFLQEYETYFSNKFAEYQSVGGALAIVYKGQVVLIKPYGVKKIGTNDSVNIHTVFRLASVSKGISGTLASILADKKIISLDATVKSYLPDFTLQKTENTNNVTIKNILSHSSGILAYSFDPSIEDGVSFDNVYHDLHKACVDAKPGERYAYQNVMFSLIDTIARLKTGKKYETLLQEYIFNPLGMIDASASLQGFSKSNNFALPHKGWRKNQYAMPINERYYSTKPAAGINASISDMSKWLQAVMGHSPNVINENVRKSISQPQVQTPLKYWAIQHWGNVQRKEYGLGWRILTINGSKVMYHGGFVEGYRAEIAYCDDKEIGIVMLLNSPNMLAAESIPYFMKTFFEFIPTIPAIISVTGKNNNNQLTASIQSNSTFSQY